MSDEFELASPFEEAGALTHPDARPIDGRGSAPDSVTGRCYCGHVTVISNAPPRIITYCHCADCRRWTGGAVGSFAGFAPDTLSITPDLGDGFSINPGVTRWNCPECGSPIAAQFGYLPQQTYVPLGVLDQIASLPPSLHCHAEGSVPWLQIDDTLPRYAGSGRDELNEP